MDWMDTMVDEFDGYEFDGFFYHPYVEYEKC